MFGLKRSWFLYKHINFISFGWIFTGKFEKTKKADLHASANFIHFKGGGRKRVWYRLHKKRQCSEFFWIWGFTLPYSFQMWENEDQMWKVERFNAVTAVI